MVLGCGVVVLDVEVLGAVVLEEEVGVDVVPLLLSRLPKKLLTALPMSSHQPT